MTRKETHIVLFDDNEQSLGLLELLFALKLQETRVTHVQGPQDFGEAMFQMGQSGADLVVVGLELNWTSSLVLIDSVTRCLPGSPLVLMRNEATAIPAALAREGRVVTCVNRNVEGMLRLSRFLDYALPAAALVSAAVAAPTPSTDSLHQQLATISHDLQEPTRSVLNYLRVFLMRHSDELSSEGRDLIETAERATVRMLEKVQGSVGSVRDSSSSAERAHRAAQAPAPAPAPASGADEGTTDCSEVLQETLENLSAAIEKQGAAIITSALPSVDVDRETMVQIFQNLLSNALKFRGDATPRIFVGAKQDQGRWIFSVRDNGIGIAPNDRERIFGMFQRCAQPQRYPGTGIGLAVCKKAVESNGGQIWVESEQGKGATFHFTLPKVNRWFDDSNNVTKKDMFDHVRLMPSISQ